MRILGTGIDLVEIARFQRSLDRFGASFLDRLFTLAERQYCDGFREPARPYAARFAAKEALSKALGTGIGGELGWLDMEVQRSTSGRPSLLLTGPGAATAGSLGIVQLHLSLSHTEHYATAQVIACGAD